LMPLFTPDIPAAMPPPRRHADDTPAYAAMPRHGYAATCRQIDIGLAPRAGSALKPCARQKKRCARRRRGGAVRRASVASAEAEMRRQRAGARECRKMQRGGKRRRVAGSAGSQKKPVGYAPLRRDEESWCAEAPAKQVSLKAFAATPAFTRRRAQKSFRSMLLLELPRYDMARDIDDMIRRRSRR